MPLCAELGIITREATGERVTLSLDWASRLCTAADALHGGAIMALADSAGAVCAFLNLPNHAAGTSTIQSSTNFIGAVRSGTVEATATPIHVGRSTIVIATEVRNDGRLVAITTQTQSILAGSPAPPA